MDDHTYSTETLEENSNLLVIKVDPPIIKLFKCLINNSGTSLTLSNMQIIQILNKEFGIDTASLHELTLDIYITIIKKYLKEWPEWDKFEQVTNKLNGSKSDDYITKILYSKYKNMKVYLKNVLEIARPLAEEATKGIEPAKEDDKVNEVVMELFSSRDQLNELLYRNPSSDWSTDIFNINPTEKIARQVWDLETIIKTQIHIHISLPCLVYVREMRHIMKHMLINKLHTKQAYKNEILDMSIMYKTLAAKKNLNTNFVRKLLGELELFYKDSPDFLIYQLIFNIIYTDLSYIKAPIVDSCCFSKILSEHAYVRYLYTNDLTNESLTKPMNYDLQIEETIIPRVAMTFSKYGFCVEEHLPKKDWLRLKCAFCGAAFVGQDIQENILKHYNTVHQSEPDWSCTNCKVTFSMRELAENMWYHEC